ncbi:hypothetical protein P262_00214 [Cronobacter malonaticus]|uniref:Uncharacterized protein n=1 Tax=Cronobacter malonaticus TaxID=413503 RepID=V5TVA4_9ENTR|nr:hypothetical protein P262_00214 [Cronobacter malonaticus]CCJ94655.1 hypothetical protein BN131_2328 [Cronobacter malonaticus 681]CCK00354.1 hypothetical protein BN130_3123 [Cronobacter malonaticus 507]
MAGANAIVTKHINYCATQLVQEDYYLYRLFSLKLNLSVLSLSLEIITLAAAISDC